MFDIKNKQDSNMEFMKNMSNFTRCNKISGFYSSTDNINNFKFRVKLKEINKSIPMLNDGDLESSFGKEDGSNYEVRQFSWQEKVSHSKEAAEIGEDDSVKEDEEDKSTLGFKRKLVSYVQNERSNHDEVLINSEKNSDHLSEKIHKSMIRNSDDANEEMIIVADMSDYENDSTFPTKREHVLFVISWNPQKGCLTVSPDFNSLAENPYLIELTYGSKQTFHYSIEPVLQAIDKEKLFEISALTKISQQDMIVRLRKKHQKFTFPPKDVLRLTFICEILSAYSFEYNDLYVEYTIDLPYGYKSNDPLKGRTQITTVNDKTQKAHFGYMFELNIDYNIRIENNREVPIPTPQIYFEIISSDTWDRYRTEGYCYAELPIDPGYKKIILHTTRPIRVNKILSNMTRFFIGEKHILKDITWIRTPSTFQGNCIVKHGISTVASGKLDININTIVQSLSLKNDLCDDYSVVDERNNYVEKVHVDSLFKSVSNVLKAYKQAKDKLRANLK